jgi:hypothetical protein
MTTQPTGDSARTPQSPDSTLATVPVVPRRSARRATARRASSRRATARQRKGDVEGRIVEYLKDHGQSTTGDIAKALNADRDTIAAGLSHIARAGDITKGSAALPNPPKVTGSSGFAEGSPRRVAKGPTGLD